MLHAAVLVLIVLALLGVSAGRTLKLKSHADFMVADRKLSASVLVFTLLCSWIGAGSLFGGSEFAYRRGLAALLGVSLLTAPPREEQWKPFFR